MIGPAFQVNQGIVLGPETFGKSASVLIDCRMLTPHDSAIRVARATTVVVQRDIILGGSNTAFWWNVRLSAILGRQRGRIYIDALQAVHLLLDFWRGNKHRVANVQSSVRWCAGGPAVIGCGRLSTLVTLASSEDVPERSRLRSIATVP